MNRRDTLRKLAAASLSPAVAALLPSDRSKAATAPGTQPSGPIGIEPGPQLFLDDYLIERTDGLTRRVEEPRRLARPVLDSATFGTTQPYLTVLGDRDQKGFRLWYNRGPAIWHARSADGLVWTDARVAWDLARSYGCSLVDDGQPAENPQRRFKLANWQATRGREDKPGDDGGMWVGFSPDGLEWTPWKENPVLPTWPEGYPRRVAHGVGDTVDVYYDAAARRYAAAVKVHALAADGYVPGPKAGAAFRRLVGISTSEDFIHWERPRRILAPDEKDQGLLEFYGMGGMHLRGSLRIGLARVLRDDLPCDAGGSPDGIGYTVLTTSRDGLEWQRYREPFFDRNPQPGSWDHAMAWMSAAVPVGDEVYFYYGGYARGHKIAPRTERQIGLARMKKDRYVALAPTGEEGKIVTRPLRISAERLTLNVRAAADGQALVRVVDEHGRPLDGPGRSDSKPVTGEALAAPVLWPKPLAALAAQPVRLEFRLRKASLFGCEFHAQS